MSEQKNWEGSNVVRDKVGSRCRGIQGRFEQQTIRSFGLQKVESWLKFLRPKGRRPTWYW